ncbi:MAG: hypothetical protein RLZZ602_115 [Pseudomonadota bacterium]|jgi:hypothetical protein
MNEQEKAQEAMVQFIELANKLKNDGLPVKVVSWGLMNASATYATYSVVGNAGALTESGIDKVAEVYKVSLNKVTEARRREAEQRAQSENKE